MSLISAVVVTFNEAGILDDCLKSLHFCDEIIGIDLGSTDTSIEILKKYRAIVHPYPKTPVVEEAKQFALQFCRHDWILFIDPDERVDSQLADEINTIISQDKGNIGIILVPWLFYYKGRALKGTFWGHSKVRKQIIINRHRAAINLFVHGGYSVLNNAGSWEIPRKGTNVLHHYWMSSLKTLLAKHKMYIIKEGAAKYKLGLRFSRKKQIKGILTEFYDSFFIFKGYRDGITGLFLSLFRSWYVFESLNSLKQYEEKINTTPHQGSETK
jgi:glycosyltransferase involved in cell wall biosynthesis